ncbi:hypothetical protein [Methylophaga frappieri]|nr:hypothetical protein [Methylophaga frappieri]
MTTKPTLRTSFSLLALMWLFLGQTAFAEAKLGIELKQGYNTAYISDIDPFGSGAASGLMASDRIKEVNGVAIWFVDQAERMLKYNIAKEQPFIVMVERKGGLNRIMVDANKPSRSFPKKKGSDFYANCYMAPDAACLETVIDNSQPMTQDNSSIMRNYSSKVERYSLLGRQQKTLSAYKQMDVLFFRDKGLINYDTATLFSAMEKLGLKPEKRHFDYVYVNTKKSVSALSGAADLFAKYGSMNHANAFYKDMVNLIKQKPKELKNKTMYVGQTLAKLGKKDQLISYLKSDQHSSETKNKLLERYIVELVKSQKKEEAQEAVNLVYSVKRSWTNGDYIIFVRLFHKLHMQDAAWNTIKRLEAFYKSGEGNMFIQPLTAGSLVEAYGAVGSIHNGRKYIDKHFKDNPLEMMMKLTIEAANSRSAKGLALQHYKDLPKLVDETYAKFKAATPEQRKKLSKLVVEQFYEVLAAYLPANPSVNELSPFVDDKYGHKGVIDAFIEVRKFDKATEWTNAVETKYGNTYKHNDILAAVGALASSHEQVEQFKRTTAFKKKDFFLKRPYLKRLYWNGYFDQALAEFNTMPEKEKVNAILAQMPFVVGCKGCTL